MTLNFLTHLTKRFLATDDAARALQLAGILRFACIFLQGIILVKAGVPLFIVGQIELVFFVTNFFMFFWQSGGNNAMMSWASGQERAKVHGVIFGAMHIHALIGICLLWIVMQFPIGSRFDFLTSGRNMIAILGSVFFSIPAGSILYAYLVRNQFKRILWFTGISQMIQIGIVSGVVVAGYGVEVMLWLLALFAFARWLFVLVSGQWFKTGLPRASGMWAFIVFALPLVIHAFNSGLMDYVDAWIVSFFYGEESFALYRYGARELPFNALLIGGLMSGLVHRYKSENTSGSDGQNHPSTTSTNSGHATLAGSSARAGTDGDVGAKSLVDATFLRKETLRIMKLLFPVNCALILLSAPLFTLLYNEDFMLSARIFNIYALTLLSRVILNQVYCYVYHHNWVLTWSTVAEVVLNIILSLILMQWMGIFGIPLATILAYAIQKVFLIYYVRKKFSVRCIDYVPIPQCIWYFAGIILCVVLAELMYF